MRDSFVEMENGIAGIWSEGLVFKGRSFKLGRQKCQLCVEVVVVKEY